MATATGATQLSPAEREAACVRALQLASGAVLPMVLKTAIELGLLDILTEDGQTAALSSEEIAARLPTVKPHATAAMVDRILRLLAANGVVGCTVEAGRHRKYSSTPICKYFTKNDAEGDTVAYLVLMHQDKVFIDLWQHLTDSVLDGGYPTQAAYGMSSFEYFGTNPRFNKLFNAAMRGHSAVTIKSLLRVYDGFASIRVLVDVGGGVGTALRMITTAHPHVRGVNFDLPHVISEAQPIPGVEHTAGDMFESVPAGDAIFLKWILHDWDDEKCVRLLRNCWKALPDEGKVVVVDYVLPVTPEPTTRAQAIYQLDLCMAAYTDGGKERTEEEFKDLASEAGFQGFKALCAFADNWVMEFLK